ncbi:MAG: acyl-CoA dehydrogenase family protein, partial [Bacteroidota bacterium]
MNFSWPQEYQDHRTTVEAFVRKKVNPTLEGLDERQQFPRQAWQACADFGIQSLALPANLGGPTTEVDFSRALLAMEGFGYACTDNGLPFA